MGAGLYLLHKLDRLLARNRAIHLLPAVTLKNIDKKVKDYYINICFKLRKDAFHFIVSCVTFLNRFVLAQLVQRTEQIWKNKLMQR